MPRKLAGRRPGAAIRHPSGTLLCLHVSKPGSDGLELTPLLPLDATRSSPCRRLGYIVTNGPAKTAHNQWIPTTTAVNNRAQPRLQTARATGPRSHRPNRAAARQALCGRGQPRTSCLGQSTYSAPVLRLQAEHRALTRPTSSTKPEPTRPAINLAKSGQSPYPLFVTARFNSSTTQRRFHHDTHSSLLVSAGPAAFSGLLQFLKTPPTLRVAITYLSQHTPIAPFIHMSLPIPPALWTKSFKRRRDQSDLTALHGTVPDPSNLTALNGTVPDSPSILTAPSGTAPESQTPVGQAVDIELSRSTSANPVAFPWQSHNQILPDYNSLPVATAYPQRLAPDGYQDRMSDNCHHRDNCHHLRVVSCNHVYTTFCQEMATFCQA